MTRNRKTNIEIGGRTFDLESDEKGFEQATRRLKRLWEDNCLANGVPAWSPLALQFAHAIVDGEWPVKYKPDLDLISNSAQPAVEYVEMLNVERNRFPSVSLIASDSLLYLDGLEIMHGKKTTYLQTLDAKMREDGLLSDEEELAVVARPPTVVTVACEDVPYIDFTTLSLRFQGKSCFLGSTIALMVGECLCRNLNRFVPITRIELNVAPNAAMDKAALSRHVQSLRKKIENAGMDDLKIDGQEKDYYKMYVLADCPK